MSTTSTSRAQGPGRQMRLLMTVAYAALFLLIVAVAGLAAGISLSGAVISSGHLVVASYPKTVQHLKGGTVADIEVKNGDRVTAGEVLIRLDDTQTRASLAIVAKRLDEMTVRAARLTAELTGQPSVTYPDAITARSDAEPAVAQLIAAEDNLFAARKSSLSRKKDQLKQRIDQLRQEIEGLSAQQTGKEQEIALIRKELTGVRDLVSKEYLSVTRLNALEREEARLTGERGGLISSVAQSRGRIAETELQILQLDDDQRSEAATTLREVQAEIAEYTERRIAAEADLKNIDIRAPQDGLVHQLAVHAAGAVVTPGEPILTIVPVSDDLVAEVRITPQDIDQLQPGQSASLRFSAFNQATTPTIEGHVSQIAADLTVDQRSGLSYYVARITFDAEQLARLGSVTLVPGMPVEAFVKTGDRTILSYLMKPMADQFNRAFREE